LPSRANYSRSEINHMLEFAREILPISGACLCMVTLRVGHRWLEQVQHCIFKLMRSINSVYGW
jgi:hypothetical protein